MVRRVRVRIKPDTLSDRVSGFCAYRGQFAGGSAFVSAQSALSIGEVWRGWWVAGCSWLDTGEGTAVPVFDGAAILISNILKWK
jgi:hypothetical protein